MIRRDSACFRPRRDTRRPARAVCAIVLAALLASPAAAGPLKDIMGEMGTTAKQSKRLLGSAFDLHQAQDVLARFGDEAGRSSALFAGRNDAKSRDLQKRFTAFERVVADARAGVSDKASFHHAFGTIAESCRACHADYK